MTKEEAKVRLQEIDVEIKSLKSLTEKMDIIQNAIKIIINSIYGAFGNIYFYFYNQDIASSVTLQGQDLIKFSRAAINHFFNNLWHKDTELHKKLGIDGYKINQVTEQATIYVDTDSSYVNFELLVKSVEGWNPTDMEVYQFIIKIFEYKLNKYIIDAISSYSKKYNTESVQNFKLENISECGVWVAKKNYVIKPVYDGEAEIFIDKPKAKPKGIDAAKPSMPIYARDKVKLIIDEILKRGPKIDIEIFVIPNLISFKKGFKMLEIDECSCTRRLRKFNEYIKTDKSLVIPKGTPINARASLYHNYLIEKTDIRRYNKIKQMDQVKIYRCRDMRPDYETIDIFAYIPGQYPIEFAPKIDYDQQFFDVVVEPINKLLNAMSLQGININLKRDISYSKSKKSSGDLYPLWAINNETLESSKIPDELQHIFGTMDSPIDTTVLDKDTLDKFLKHASIYGMNTVIVPNYDYQAFIKREEKKKEIKRIKNLGKDGLRESFFKCKETRTTIEKKIIDLELEIKSKELSLSSDMSIKKTDYEFFKKVKDDIKVMKDELRDTKKQFTYWDTMLETHRKAALELRRELIKAKESEDGDDGGEDDGGSDD